MHYTLNDENGCPVAPTAAPFVAVRGEKCSGGGNRTATAAPFVAVRGEKCTDIRMMGKGRVLDSV